MKKKDFEDDDLPTLEHEVSGQLAATPREGAFQEGDLEEHMTEEHVDDGVYSTL